MSLANQSDSTAPGLPTELVPYERLMRENWEWGMNQSSLFFEGKGRVQETLRRITRRLSELQIPYAVAYGMALFYHGYQRYTEDVDILVTQAGLDRLHEAVDGSGFVRPFSVSKNLRDVETGVKIEFLIAGAFPGDGKPNEVAFPDPAEVGVEISSIRFINLPTFITLKLTSGLTGEGRGKDINDVFELIKAARLDESYASQLSPFVRDEFLKQYALARRVTRYVATESVSPDRLAVMLADGVHLDPKDNLYVTNDPSVAAKHGMSLESEFVVSYKRSLARTRDLFTERLHVKSWPRNPPALKNPKPLLSPPRIKGRWKLSSTWRLM